MNANNPGDPFIEFSSGGNPWGEAPASGNPPYVRAYVCQETRGKWQLSLSALLVIRTRSLSRMADEAEEQKRLAIGKFDIKTNVKVLASRSPLRQELVDLATKWATEHPEQFEAGGQISIPGRIRLLGRVCKGSIGKDARGSPAYPANAVGSGTGGPDYPHHAGTGTDKAVKALEAAISAARAKAKRLFASSGVMAARQ